MIRKHKTLGIYLGLFFFLLLLLLGINTGETLAILEKATRICLSCIGLG